MKKIIITISVIVVSIGAICFKLYSNQEEATNIIAEEKKAIPFSIEAAIVQVKEMNNSSTYTAEIQPFKKVSLVSETDGKVVFVNFKKGGKVAKGQELVKVDATILKANVEIQKASISKLRKDLARIEALYIEKNATLNEVENIELQLKTAEEQLKIAKKQCSQTIILSPLNAFVAEKNVNEGEILQQGSPVALLVNGFSNTLSIYANTGMGGFAPKVDYATGDSPISVSIGDLTGDGKADIAVVNQNSNTLSIFTNTGIGGFATKVDYATDSGPFSVSISDLTGDGKVDIAVVDRLSNTLSIYINTGVSGITSLEEVPLFGKVELLAIYPNPNNGHFSVESKSPTTIKAQLLNAQGGVVGEFILTNGLNEIKLALPQGIYLLKANQSAVKVMVE